MSAVLRELRTGQQHHLALVHTKVDDLSKVAGTNLALPTFKHLCFAPR